MALLLSCRSLSKQFGSEPLFRGLTFTLSDGERHGLIGPNGSGKSTLLEILAGRQSTDAGEVVYRKMVRTSYVCQDPAFDEEKSVQEILMQAAEEPSLVGPILGQAGFQRPEIPVNSLSGGWRKRLSIARALVEQPDLLLLDEPTNHLDVEGIEWLESTLLQTRMACLIVSHDRYFLENIATHMIEVNRIYPDGLFRVAGKYSQFLEKREAYFESQAKERDALASVVRREVEWLRRGAKARSTKAKARVDSAQQKIESLAEMDSRREVASTAIDFTATERQTKRLLVAEGLGKHLGGRKIVGDLNLILCPGMRLGLAGGNGSGKTTILRLLSGEYEPDTGTMQCALGLQVVYFDQHREQLHPAWTLRQALAAEGDTVLYRGQAIHINGWAKRFLFRTEQLDQPVSSLSGGERARVLIARLMLHAADLLLLDEPTNDLDIPTLEVLEESLQDFPGALVLVTHDRYLLDRICTAVLGLDGQGGSMWYADRLQYEADLKEKGTNEKRPVKPSGMNQPSSAAGARKKLSYLDQREWDSMEEKIHLAEERWEEIKAEMNLPEVRTDPNRLESAYHAMLAAEQEVKRLYDRWAELEEKRIP